MSIFSENPERKRSKELKNEIKELKKLLQSDSLDKKLLETQMKDFKEALEMGGDLRLEYVNSQEHLALARRGIIDLLENMGDSPAEEVKKSLEELTGHLDGIYHECSIRRDDLDFASTAECLKDMVAHFERQNMIMVRSELENLQSLLEDTSEWRSPNFFALAYFFLHEERNRVGEMENEYRNEFVLKYLNENLMNQLTKEAEEAGCRQKLIDMIQNFIYES